MSEYIIRPPEKVGSSLDLQPIIVGEIVRCRDCKHRYGCLHMLEDSDGDMLRCDSTPDSFCAWAERRDA